jgi:HAD superfamily hydrolase (TIGR01549 family)
MAADALIFDLDGTVWDSARWFARVFANGDPLREECFRKELAGTGNIVRVLNRENYSREKLIRRAIELSGGPPLFTGMAEALDDLKRSGIPLGVATSLPGSIALPMLKAAALETLFGTVIHAGICKAPKPSPASINMALRQLKISAGPNVFYVGDRGSDAEAALQAGVSFAWMIHGYETPSSGIQPLQPEELITL